MIELAEWLQHQMQSRDLTQAQLAVYAGLAQGTISDILRKGHIPRVETLFRLADYFDTDRVEVLILAGHLGPADQYEHPERPEPDHDEQLNEQLLEAFRLVPDEWKEYVIAQAQLFVRLANRPPFRIIGDEDEDTEAQPEPTWAEEQDEEEE
jgi:transcriptional regulator with XRE-family HTH domain